MTVNRIAVLLGALVWCCGCAADESPPVADEFLQVARELRDGDYQLADMHLEKLERVLADPELSLVEQLDARLSLAHQKMVRGYAEEAVRQIELILRLMQLAIDNGVAWDKQRNFVFKGRGVAYMHLAEQVRCGVERGARQLHGCAAVEPSGSVRAVLRAGARQLSAVSAALPGGCRRTMVGQRQRASTRRAP